MPAPCPFECTRSQGLTATGGRWFFLGGWRVAMLRDAGDVVVGAPTRVEAGIVVQARYGASAMRELDLLLDGVGAQTVPLDAEAAALAIRAWRRFGKGRHPASLNLGDCFSYATAKSVGAPLLYKGDDLGQTDIASAR
ncbi:MAG: type II toxin-antitoxin system VapC family toxin [Dermatophilaceae bacterium]